MEDEGSGDMKIFSREKENKKVFNVHKSFFLDFRCFEKTIYEMISYVYTESIPGRNSTSRWWPGCKTNTTFLT